jgi:tetratricopeptide (TPR) repeat protein
MAWLDRVLGSRWMGLASLVLVLVGVGSLLRGWWPADRTVPFQELSIPPRAARELEPAVVRHLEETERVSQRVLGAADGSPRQRGRAYGELGRIYITYALDEQASAALVNATQLDRDSFEWPYLLAHVRQRLEDLPGAQQAMTEAQLRLKGDASGKAEDHLSVACALADVAQKLGQTDTARRHLDAALKIHPQCLYALLLRGRLASDADRHVEALRDLEQAVDLQPKSKELRTALSNALRRKGDLAEARRWAVEMAGADWRPVTAPHPRLAALMRQSRSSNIANRLASRLREQGRLLSSLREFSAGLARNPDSVPLLANRANCLEKLERFAEAKADLERARQLKPETESLRLQWCQVCVRLPADRDQALAEAQAWTEENPQNALAWVALASCLMAAHRPAEALPHWKQASELDSAWLFPRQELLQCLGQLGKFAELDREVRQLVKDFPGQSTVSLLEARSLACGPVAERRDPQRALEILERLLADRGTAVLLESQAAAWHTLGDRDQAEPAIQKALEIVGNEAAPAVQRRMRALQRAIVDGNPYVEPWPLADPAQTQSNAAHRTDSPKSEGATSP